MSLTGRHPPHRVPGEDLAEWLLRNVTSPSRAAAIVGDLSEQATEHSTAWFWQCTLRITAACARQNLLSVSIQETGMNRESHGFLTTLWQHKWLLTTCVLVSIGITTLALAFYPARYRSQTVLLVVPTRIPDEYVHAPKATYDITDRLITLQQQILSRTRLERIVNEFNLYDDTRKRETMEEDIIQRMRKDISVAIVGRDAFRVSFDGSNPRIVQRVTERLASLFIEQNLNDRAVLAELTDHFLESQLDDTRRQLDEREIAINARTKAGRSMSKAESIEFDVLQQQYRDLLAKQQTATLARDLERRQIGEQFKLLEAARIPSEPITPNRKAATASGAAAGLGVGIALIGFTARRRRLGTDDVDGSATGVER